MVKWHHRSLPKTDRWFDSSNGHAWEVVEWMSDGVIRTSSTARLVKWHHVTLPALSRRFDPCIGQFEGGAERAEFGWKGASRLDHSITRPLHHFSRRGHGPVGKTRPLHSRDPGSNPGGSNPGVLLVTRVRLPSGRPSELEGTASADAVVPIVEDGSARVDL